MATARFIEGIGRRKTAIARVRITPASRQEIMINKREFANYFPSAEGRRPALTALAKAPEQKFSVSALIRGGGISA